jgi:Cu(I)/Ag(I) efflux system membrane fusion protein
MSDQNNKADAPRSHNEPGSLPSGFDPATRQPPRTHHQDAPGLKRLWTVVKVIEVRLRFIAVLAATGLIIGYWDTIKNYWDRWDRSAAPAAAPTDSDTEFYCPMHPNVVRPGLDPNGEIPKCPICGMKLSLRKKGESAMLPEGVQARVQLSPDRIRLAGIQTVPVTYEPLVKEIRAVGYVGYDESRLSRIVSRVSGYLEKLYVDKTWVTVNEGDALAEIYSQDLASDVQNFLLNLRSNQPELVTSTRERLRRQGIEDSDIDKIQQSGKANHLLVLRSPQSGHVIRKDVVKGARVESGSTLFEVADLSIVWVEADLFEKDIPFLRVGQPVVVTVEAIPNKEFHGKVGLVHPHLEPMTRTNAVRVELDNSEHELRPGMFATVRIQAPLSEIEPFKSLAATGPLAANAIRSNEPREYFVCPSHPGVMMDKPAECPNCHKELESRPLNDDQLLFWWCPMHPKVTADKSGTVCDDCSGMKLVPRLLLLAKPGEVLAVPERSVIDTGSKKIVYVEREPGLFDGMLVELGPRTGGYYPVVSGLEPGERVAAAGAFLVDAETRLNPAAAASYVGASGATQAKQGSSVRPRATSNDRNKTGNRAAKSKANAKEAGAAKALTAEELQNVEQLSVLDRELALAQGTCPITDQPLGSMGVPPKVTVKGQTVFLCCAGCEPKVKRDPDKVLKKLAETKK